MIYAFDFDNTLAITDYPVIIEPIQKVINFAKQKQKEGHIIILWTCREDQELKDALNWCFEQGLVFDSVNDNPKCQQLKWGNNCRKIYADYYIDDHCLPIKDIIE